MPASMDSPSPERLRSGSEAETGDKDWISCLPEDVMDFILSLLTSREAQATCLLSRRWRHLSSCRVTNLDFDWSDLLAEMRDKPELAEKERARYVEWVDNVLHQQSRRGYHLRRFALFFDLNISYKSHIDRWISFALAKPVKVLQLNFESADLKDSNLPYLIEHETLMNADVGCSQRVLGLSNSGLSPFSSWHVGFRYLEELTLNRVTMKGDLIEQLLANCPVLERLTLKFICTSNRLRVSGRALKLKYLFIACCHDLERIEIYDIDLVSLTLGGMETLLYLDKLPQLSEVSIMGSIWTLLHDMWPQLSSLPRLQILELEFNYMPNDYLRFCQLPKLTTVKQLKLKVHRSGDASLLPLTVVIEACPCLQSFVFEFMYPWWIPRWKGKDLEKVVRPLLHQSLKEVEFYNYYGRLCHLELVTYLMENAVALEKLVVNTCDKEYVSGEWKKLKEPRERALQQLKGKVPSKIDLVVN